MTLLFSLLVLLLLPSPGSAAPLPLLEARLLVSNSAPYLGEEVILTLEVRRQGALRERPSLAWPLLDDFLQEELPPLLPRRETTAEGEILVESGRTLLRPLKTGTLRLSGGGVSLGEDFIAAPPLRLRVRPLPEEGRPSDFSGAVGRYTLTLRGEGTGTREVRLEIGGTGVLSNVPAPRAAPGRGERLVFLGDDLSFTEETALRTLRYLYLPGEGEKGSLAFTLATFDPQEESYRLLSASLNPPPGRWGAWALRILLPLAGVSALALWGRQQRRNADLDYLLARLLGRAPRGLSRREIAATLMQSGVRTETWTALERLWEEEDLCRFGPVPRRGQNLRARRRRLALRLWNDVDKSRRIP
ncbi:hypothetical protein DSOUD_2345 [Desulfuromonas soudanensis]|uniref:Oxygen tolerance n=1 Tax=Desulfuromonas soudanensis TaxID=1603606 RepID=A0A0M4DJ75_9BACT|nr:BatD family protein [Desulfuromonas soudanensis]ALC17107.1 hypothetical protein DSOUD_2345 [Desulfuromonas soudanensis]